MLHVYPVDEYVAFGPMPEPYMLPELLRTFDVIVAAVESYEMSYLPSQLPPNKVFMHEPVADYTWPKLSQLLRVAKLASSAAEQGKKVFIHCLGGRGRSATFAAGYLVYRYHMPAREAVEYVRSMRSGALEHPGQEGVLRSLEAVLAAAQEEALDSREDEEKLRVAGMLAEALARAQVAALHGAIRLLSPRPPRRLGRVVAAIDELGVDAEKVALLDLEQGAEGKGHYVVKTVVVGYSAVVEAVLNELAEALRDAFPLTLRSVEVSEPEYW